MSDQFYSIKDNSVIEKFDDGALVLRLPDRNIFQCNLTALKVLELTDGKHDVQEISKIIAKTFDITQEQALTDITALYTHLQNKEIVESMDYS